MAASFVRSFSALSFSKGLLRNKYNSYWLTFVVSKKTEAREVVLPPKPKKPPTAFIEWASACRDQYQKKYPHLRHKELLAKLGEIWASECSMEEKTKWINIYLEKKEQYNISIEEFMQSLSPEEREALNEQKKECKEKRLKKQSKQMRKRDQHLLGKPKRPPNAFLMFVADQDRKGVALKDYLHIASAKWKEAPELERNFYQNREKQLREQYRKEMQEWELKMIRTGRSDLVRINHQRDAFRTTPSSTLDFLKQE